MSLFDDSAITAVFLDPENFGESVTLDPDVAGVSPLTVNAVVEREAMVNQQTGRGKQVATLLRVYVARRELGASAKLTYGGEVYAVTQVLEDDPAMMRLQCEHVVTASRERDGGVRR